ncbi:MAG: T9SS type A sorting domain-containing protein, partial [Cytophagales bacterium]|nr:T9SS type A sorting domain-containing protein [Cytophagales bacterium]
LTLSIAVGGETNHLESNPTHADYVNTSAAFIGYLDYVNIMTYDACMSCHPTYTTHSPLAFAQQAVAGYSGTTLGTPSYTFNWPKSKLLIGIAFYAQPTNTAYSTINASNSATIFNSDVSGIYGGYNGCPTIQSKMDWAQSQGLGGVFVWELGQDLITSNAYSLLGCMAARAVLKSWTVPSFSNPCPLSSQILEIKGQRQGQEVVINWKTVDETNASRFELQRSIDGAEFKSVNSIEAAGTPKFGKAYSLTDFYPGSGQVYYRLAQFDVEGKMTKSETIVISATSELALRLIPNPSEGYANVLFENLTSYTEASVWILNVEGKELFHKDYVAGEVTGITIGETLTSGVYFVKVVAEGKSTVQKFVKK